MADDVSAASSPAAAASSLPESVQTAVSAGDFEAFREAKRHPDAPDSSSASSAASRPAEPAEQAASTDASLEPASEPAKKSKNKGADARIQELLAERAAERQRAERLELRLAELERTSNGRHAAKDAKPAASSSAPVLAPIPDAKRYLAMPQAPKLEAFDTLEEWTVASTIFVNDMRHAERVAQQQQETQYRQHVDRLVKRDTTFSESLKAAAASDPDFVSKVNPALFALKTAAQAQADGERLTVQHAIAEELIDSPIAPQLLLHLTAHPEDYQALQAATGKDDLKKRFGRLEGRLQRDTPTAGSASGVTPKPVTDAPAPVTTVGSRPGIPADAVRSAVARGDFSAFRAAKRALGT